MKTFLFVTFLFSFLTVPAYPAGRSCLNGQCPLTPQRVIVTRVQPEVRYYNKERSVIRYSQPQDNSSRVFRLKVRSR